MSQKISRRRFAKTVGMGGAGLAVSWRASSYANIVGANDRVRVGIVGFGDRCRSTLVPAFLLHAKELNFEIVGVSDIWNRRRDEGGAFLQEQTGKPVFKARNNEELYDHKDVDAVIIATADFQHAQHAIQAVKAGRDTYVEKPFANTMDDAREALRVVSESRQILQVGTQRRSGPNYIAANDYIRSGAFGPLVMVEMTWNINQPGRWRRPQLVAEIHKEDTDWQRFLINRPVEEWDPRKYIEFRLFWPYSSGIPCQWMVHQIDTVHWFSGLKHPRSVVANSGIYLWRDGRRNADTMTAVFDYGPDEKPDQGFQVVYSSRTTNAAGGIKELYYSNAGTLNLDTNRITPEGGLTEKEAAPMGMKPNLLAEGTLGAVVKAETGANTGIDAMTVAHMRNWMECVRSRKAPNADIHAAYNHSVALCMTIAALQTGKRVRFDDSQQKVVLS